MQNLRTITILVIQLSTVRWSPAVRPNNHFVLGPTNSILVVVVKVELVVVGTVQEEYKTI